MNTLLVFFLISLSAAESILIGLLALTRFSMVSIILLWRYQRCCAPPQETTLQPQFYSGSQAD